MLNGTAACFSPVLADVTLGLFATSLTESLLNRFRISREPVGIQTFSIDLNRLRGFGCGFIFLPRKLLKLSTPDEKRQKWL
jgi:hypothetical protein